MVSSKSPGLRRGRCAAWAALGMAFALFVAGRVFGASPPERSRPPAAVERWIDSALGDLARGRLEAAAGKLRLARWSVPDEPYSGLLLAWVHAARGEWQQASELASTLDVAPEDGQLLRAALGMQAAAYEKTGRPADAARAYWQILDVEPDSAMAHLGLGRLALAASSDAAAAQELAGAWGGDEAASGAGPGGRDVWLARAEEHLESAARRSPDLLHAHVLLGSTLMEMGRFAEAVAALKDASRLQPRLPEVHHLLGQAYERLGQRDAALAEYRRALDIDPNYLPAARHLQELNPAAPAPVSP